MATAVGRERELQQVASFLDPAGAGRVLLLEGEPGIGKTTVWEEALAAAEPSWRVLRARPLEVEARISFAAVGDLLAGALDEARTELPSPQLRALEIALLLAEPGTVPPDPQAIAFAFLSGLRLLARPRPLLVAIDDVQWLDQPSAAVLLCVRVASTLTASRSPRKGVLVRAPSSLKDALVRETARKGASLNDVAVGLLAELFGVDYRPTGRKSALPGSSPVILLRMPEELRDAIRAEAERVATPFNDVVLRALADGLGVPFRSNRRKEAMAKTNGSQNGHARQNGKVRVAIIGVGNCANSLLQGVHYYQDASPDDFVPGLMHVDLGGYHIRDIEFVAAFDVVKGKVGADLADAIWAHPNDTIKFADVPKTGIKVSRGMTHDGIGKYLSEVVEKAPGETDDVVGILKETGADVVVNYLPVGSEAATKWYTEQILEAGVAMVNCMPVFIAREPYWQRRFEEAGVPIIGDDIKSQVGATISHRILTTMFRDRGVHLDKTMQLNVGGNSDFLNMLERDRLESKKISKTNAVTSMLDYDIGAENVHVGPSDYVPWLTDRKWAYIRMEGTTFGDVPLNIELKLEVWDSPNSAGIVIDAVRLAKLALNNGVAGALEAPSSYLMKSPPKQIRDDEARENTERFIKQHTRKPAKVAAKA